MSIIKWTKLAEVKPLSGEIVWCKLKNGSIHLAARNEFYDINLPPGFASQDTKPFEISNWAGMNHAKTLSWSDNEVDGWCEVSFPD